jgi:hypothetical protein
MIVYGFDGTVFARKCQLSADSAGLDSHSPAPLVAIDAPPWLIHDQVRPVGSTSARSPEPPLEVGV